MATDVEESDTDERDKPEPVCKKQRFITNIHQQATSSTTQNNQEPLTDGRQDETISEEEDRRAREKLRCWQACQIAKGFVDNTINRVIENYHKSPSMAHPFEDPWYCLLRGNQMEDTAVSMAIRNHGLVPSLNHVIPICPLVNEEVSDLSEDTVNLQTAVTENSSETLVLTDWEAASTSGEGDYLDDTYDSDHQQNFLDRAVDEAIKKKRIKHTEC